MSNDALIFFGAGASRPFGIPTMKELVELFETNLEKPGDSDEAELYKKVKEILKEKYEAPDLEAVFSVIDAISQDIHITDWDDSTFFYYKAYLEKYGKIKPPPKEKSVINKNDVKTAKSLKSKFEIFIKEHCLINDNNFEEIDKVYSEFFDFLAKNGHKAKINGKNINFGGGYISSGAHYYRYWPIFTTNYDLCIESYWEGKNIPFNTGFRYDSSRRSSIMDPNIFANQPELKLFKLHGSINWFREEDGEIVEYSQRPSGPSFRRRQPLGEVMIYPISEKYMYRAPFLDMFYHFRNELRESPCWIIIGYSFRDEAIKNILKDNANEDKMIIVVHPKAKTIIDKELSDIQVGELIPIEQRFGDPGLVNEIVNLMRNP